MQPKWEDDWNVEGGKWVVTIPVEEDLEEELETSWLLLTGGLLGSSID